MGLQTSHLGMMPVNRLIHLLNVVVPQKQSPPRNCKTVINQSELKLLQFNFTLSSSITQKNSVLNQSQWVNDYSLFDNYLRTVSNLQNNILWAFYCVFCNFYILLSWAVSNKYNDGTALGHKQRIIGRENSAKGTNKMTEQGMNLRRSIQILLTLVSSQPVNQNLDLFLDKCRSHLQSAHRSFVP